MKKINISGWLYKGNPCGGEEEVLCLHQGDSFDSVEDGIVLAELLESDIANTVSSFSYWIVSTNKYSKSEVHEVWLKKLLGFTACEFEVRYSDPTGYLWTTNDLEVGGHDLIERLEDSVGKFLIMEIEVFAYPWSINLNLESMEVYIHRIEFDTAEKIFSENSPCPSPDKLKHYLNKDGHYLSRCYRYGSMNSRGELSSVSLGVIANSAQDAKKAADEWIKQLEKTHEQ